MAGAANAPPIPASTERRPSKLFALTCLPPLSKPQEGAKAHPARRRLSAELQLCVLRALEKAQNLVTLAPCCAAAVGAAVWAARGRQMRVVGRVARAIACAVAVGCAGVWIAAPAVGQAKPPQVQPPAQPPAKP